jgi:tRNA(His) guanylyltransferase
MKDALGDRMKANYEDRYRIKLTRRMPVILRLDGKAFHTLTKGCEKPFDQKLCRAMYKSAYQVCGEIQGFKCAYIQSDEVSILLTDFNRLTTDAWFDYNLQKIVSVASSMMTAWFNFNWSREVGQNPALFDCRAFNVPKEEVTNYFVWRQKDWFKNSLSMFARNFFPHKQLIGKNADEIHQMLHSKGENWAKLSDVWKNGTFITRGEESPEGRGLTLRHNVIFVKNRDEIERHLKPIED